MGKVSNVITLASLLSSGRKYNINELANILEVTPRMIRVYKDELEKCGIYIDTIRGPYGGYVLNQSIKIPKRKLRHDDIKLLAEIEAKIKDNDLREQFIVLKDKISGIYFENNNDNQNQPLTKEIQTKYNNLSKAIKEKRKVKIIYYSLTKGYNERIIHPLDLFLYETNWSVAAFCENRQDLRHFDLYRIKEYILLDKKF